MRYNDRFGEEDVYLFQMVYYTPKVKKFYLRQVLGKWVTLHNPVSEITNLSSVAIRIRLETNSNTNSWWKTLSLYFFTANLRMFSFRGIQISQTETNNSRVGFLSEGRITSD